MNLGFGGNLLKSLVFFFNAIVFVSLSPYPSIITSSLPPFLAFSFISDWWWCDWGVRDLLPLGSPKDRRSCAYYVPCLHHYLRSPTIPPRFPWLLRCLYSEYYHAEIGKILQKLFHNFQFAALVGILLLAEIICSAILLVYRHKVGLICALLHSITIFSLWILLEKNLENQLINSSYNRATMILLLSTLLKYKRRYVKKVFFRNENNKNLYSLNVVEVLDQMIGLFLHPPVVVKKVDSAPFPTLL